MQTAKTKKVVTKEEVTKLRLRKIRQYSLKSLSDPDLLQANLGAGASDLMETAFQLKQVIDEVLSDEPERLKAIEVISPVLDMYLKFNRQIDRFVQLDRRLKSTPKEGHTEI
jgi:hypothetical protein